MWSSRRLFVSGLGLAPLAARSIWAQSDRPGGLILRQYQPQNLESPFAAATRQFVTPVEQFYVRSHFPTPTLDTTAFRLRVEGHVEKPFEISYSELQQLQRTTLPATLECAGNGRIYLTPAAAGVQWEQGAVSNGEWAGVLLSRLLERAGVRSGAVEVVLEGADKGEVRNEPRPQGVVNYARGLTMQKAMQAGTLLATHMNGQPLTPAHGSPLRAMVPGWYGMASVKWLQRILVLDRPYTGYFQTTDYAYWDRTGGVVTRRPLTEMQVKASIAQPTSGERVTRGAAYKVTGAAWAGEAEVAKVEVSVDNGTTWQPARLLDGQRYTWRRWEWDWQASAQAGRTTLMARATDTQGRTQAMKHNADLGSYGINFVVSIAVEVG